MQAYRKDTDVPTKTRSQTDILSLDGLIMADFLPGTLAATREDREISFGLAADNCPRFRETLFEIRPLFGQVDDFVALIGQDHRCLAWPSALDLFEHQGIQAKLEHMGFFDTSRRLDLVRLVYGG